MSLILFAHPFSSYCWKVLIALYQDQTPFTYRMIEEANAMEELKALWPFSKFPLLRAGDAVIMESSVIVEYLMLHNEKATRWIPDNNEEALKVRFMDRFFDNYVMTPMQKIVADSMRSEEDKDARGVSEAKAVLDIAYAWIDKEMARDHWAVGSAFTLADCSAAPALFYADWAHPIGQQFPNTLAYRKRLLSNPSVMRVVEEARPYRNYFPLGAPDRD